MAIAKETAAKTVVIMAAQKPRCLAGTWRERFPPSSCLAAWRDGLGASPGFTRCIVVFHTFIESGISLLQRRLVT